MADARSGARKAAGPKVGLPGFRRWCWQSVLIDGGKLDFLNLRGAKLTDVDGRGTDFRPITGLGSMAGVVIDDYQLGLLAPLLAVHLGVTVL